MFINFGLHFLKIFFPFGEYFNDLPYSLARISLENICTVNIVLFPILYLTKNKYCLDAITILGFISGITAIFCPFQLYKYDFTTAEAFIETARYYFCHMILVVVPILILYNDIHKLSYRRIYPVGISFLIILVIVFLNKLYLKATGLINVSWNDFFSNNQNNPSMVFGPPSNLLEGPFSFIANVVPSIFKYTNSEGHIRFIPIVWFLVPLFIILTCVEIPFILVQFRTFKFDYYKIKARIRLIRNKHE